VATKRTRSGSKTTKKKAAAAPRPKVAAKAPAKPAAAKPAPAPRPAAALRPSEPSALARAEALRDAILRSKLTAPDPWGYTAKARAWGQRAQQCVDQLARDANAAGARQALDKLTAEVQGDRDFQEARRLF
jgi:hypothetical protein